MIHVEFKAHRQAQGWSASLCLTTCNELLTSRDEAIEEPKLLVTFWRMALSSCDSYAGIPLCWAMVACLLDTSPLSYHLCSLSRIITSPLSRYWKPASRRSSCSVHRVTSVTRRRSRTKQRLAHHQSAWGYAPWIGREMLPLISKSKPSWRVWKSRAWPKRSYLHFWRNWDLGAKIIFGTLGIFWLQGPFCN